MIIIITNQYHVCVCACTQIATTRPDREPIRNLIKRDQFVVEDNPIEINSVPFPTYFVTDYLADANETRTRERQLEEQLVRDLQLMGGSELALVDDVEQSAESQSTRAPGDELDDGGPARDKAGATAQEVAPSRAPASAAGAGARSAASADQAANTSAPSEQRAAAPTHRRPPMLKRITSLASAPPDSVRMNVEGKCLT